MSKTGFVDRFSRQSNIYVSARPDYPREIFEFLAGVTPDRKAVWDCATGNGQAALALSEFFDIIYATDASEQQISNARSHEKVRYSVATAENSGLEAHSVDLVTAATAAHWFDLDKFYRESQRVLKPGGVIAMWAYARFQTTDEAVNMVLNEFGRETLGKYWDSNLQRIWQGYEQLPFPFTDISHGPWIIKTNWSRDDLVSYVSTWSAFQNYIDFHGKSPRSIFEEQLADAWPEADRNIAFSTKLTSRVGRA